MGATRTVAVYALVLTMGNEVSSPGARVEELSLVKAVLGGDVDVRKKPKYVEDTEES